MIDYVAIFSWVRVVVSALRKYLYIRGHSLTIFTTKSKFSRMIAAIAVTEGSANGTFVRGLCFNYLFKVTS